MADESCNKDYWSLSSTQLAGQINRIARAEPWEIDDGTRTEAALLAAEWQEVLGLPSATFQDQQRRVALLDALQKRTIQILIRTGGSS